MSDPVKKSATIVNDLGLHTRSATILVRLTNTFASHIEISVDGISANAKSIMGLLALGARKGKEVWVTARGEDQEAAVAAVVGLIEQGFDEKDH